MSISLFGLVLTATICVFIIISRNIKRFFMYMFLLTLIVTLNIRMGYFIRIGESYKNYENILVYATLLSSVPLAYRLEKQKKKTVLAVALFFFSIGIGLLLNIMDPYPEKVVVYDWENYVRRIGNVMSNLTSNSPKLGYYLMYLCIVIIILIAKSVFSRKDWLWLLHKIVCVSKISVVFGVVEFIIVNIFKSRLITEVCIKVFGQFGAQQNWLVSRGGLFTIQGATKEASMYTTVVFYIAVLLLLEISYSAGNQIKEWLWLFASVILLLLNAALSSVIYVTTLVFIIYTLGFLHKRKVALSDKLVGRRVILILMTSTGLLAWLFIIKDKLSNSNNYIISRIGFAINQLEIIWKYGVSYTISSEAIRFTGIIYDIKILLKRPLFGFGLGALTCNSGIITLLVGVGIIGCITWYFLYINICFQRKSVKNIVLFWEIMIIPSIIQNELLTIMCMIIPFICIMFDIREMENNKLLQA